MQFFLKKYAFSLKIFAQLKKGSTFAADFRPRVKNGAIVYRLGQEIFIL